MKDFRNSLATGLFNNYSGRLLRLFITELCIGVVILMAILLELHVVEYHMISGMFIVASLSLTVLASLLLCLYLFSRGSKDTLSRQNDTNDLSNTN